jgi:hypothetical protein
MGLVEVVSVTGSRVTHSMNMVVAIPAQTIGFIDVMADARMAGTS